MTGSHAPDFSDLRNRKLTALYTAFRTVADIGGAPTPDDPAAGTVGAAASLGRSLLIVGCGDHAEARFLSTAFECRVLATDIDPRSFPPPDPDGRVAYTCMDGQRLALADGSIDLVFSFHALEHIPDPVRALAEMNRVLKPGGAYCIGTPNRSRLIGYLGSPTDAWTKLKWNLIDWKAMLTGRFRNEYGAHAGFTADELAALCRAAFGNAHDVTRIYFDAHYPSHRGLLRVFTATGLDRLLLPSVYVVGRKASGTV